MIDEFDNLYDDVEEGFDEDGIRENVVGETDDDDYDDFYDDDDY